MPEVLGMIHVGEMTEFVNDHVIQYLLWCEYQPVIKGKCATGGTASPAAFLVAYRDGGVIASGKLMIVSDPLGKGVPCCIAIAFFKSLEALVFCRSEVNVCNVFLHSMPTFRFRIGQRSYCIITESIISYFRYNIYVICFRNNCKLNNDSATG